MRDSNQRVHPSFRMNKRPIFLLSLLLCFPSTSLGQQQEESEVDFATQIQPLLSDRCFTCHGPDRGQRKADLRLDQEDDAKDFAISPGDPEDSELMARILSKDSSEMMPPPSSKLPQFTDKEVELIRTWIKQGAKWGKHWAFELPGKSLLPEVGDTFHDFGKGWVRNSIDAFVLSRLESEGINPSVRADRETLIRRLRFDITGLPPAVEEVEEFCNEPDFEAALNTLVDRLLASPQYGERMTSDWLDVARYSDTYGFQVDRDRRVWPWRDWVIKAFNENKPYSEFAIEQVAGDMLPEATHEQVLATTFNRLHPQKVEGGSIEEEFRVEYVADRTQTFSTAFLGLTMECARCHDHKYDPLSQKEYYQLSSFFDNVDEAGLYSFFTNSTPTPTLDLPTVAQRESHLNAEKERREAESAMKHYLASDEFSSEYEIWLDEFDGNMNSKPILHESFEGEDGKLGGANKSCEGKVGRAVQLTGDDAFNTSVGNFTRDQPFSISLWINPEKVMQRAVVLHRSRAWTDAASRGYQILIEDGKLSWSLVHFWPGNAIRIKTNSELPVNQWTHVTVTYNGNSQASGLQIFLDGKIVGTEVVRDKLNRAIAGGGGENIAIGERFRDFGFANGKVDELKVFDYQLSGVEVRQLHSTDIEIDHFIWINGDLRQYFASRVSEKCKEHRSRVTAARKKQYELKNGEQQIMVMNEMASPRTTYLLERGAYDQRGEEVQPATPNVLGAFGDKFPTNRLGLAKWLVSRENPLTARVYVNRVWQLLMGQGLVRTPEDFGVQGQAPTHPELLDWLAVDFVENGWDIKRLIKQVVTSSTYLQSSKHRVDLLELDPENRLLARGPRYRLSAEMLRDNALATGGMLSLRQGGPPSKPYEVEASFKPSNRDKGEGLYRRSLYTYWRRTAPAPAMMTLDAAKRDVCRVKRERTSSPLQAFVLFNSPQFVESARGLAESLAAKHGADDLAIIQNMFHVLTSRVASDEELLVLQRLFEQQLDLFEAQPEDATKYLSVGDRPAVDGSSVRLAALTVVANALLGFDDAVMKK